MANIFAIITAVLLGASAFLAFKNKEALETEVVDRQQAESALKQTQSRLAKLQDERNATIDEKEQTMSATVNLREDQAAEEGKIAKIESEISAKKKQSNEQAAQIDAIKAETKDAGEIRELAGKIKRLQEEIVGLEAERSSMESKRTNLLAVRNSTSKTVQTYVDENKRVSSKKSFGNARISSIYSPWGFVTLSEGNNGGIVSGSTLNVVRGGEAIAALRVRSVESNRASADIVPSSVGEDVTLMVGDRVVPAEPAEAN